MKRYFNIIGSSIIIILILTSIIFYTKQESITKTNLKENVIIEKLAQGAFINIQTEKISNKDMPQDNDIEDGYSIKGKKIEEADYLYDMHSLDFIEEQEAQRYFEDDFINSIKTSMQEGCLLDMLVKLQIDYKILEEKERSQFLDKEQETEYWYLYGYQYHVECREDIWIQIPNNHNTMDIVILNTGALEQKEYYYFHVNEDGSTEECYQGCIMNQNPKYIYNNTPIISHLDREKSKE